ncbi:hypothetical protein KCV07_g5216, partial [Aureobasidium melanogenum]
MAEISGLREQILANYNFMGFNQSASEVDVVVRFLDQKYYQATIADISSGEDICGETHQARTVERALAALLAHTCTHLGNPPNLIGAGATQTLASPLVKRTRGRPKSILPATASSAVKPRATRAAPAAKAKISTAVTPKVTRARGRPRKSEVVVPPSTGRPRGRPRKNPAATAPDVPDVTEDVTTAPAKRGRGRPKKSDSTPAAATTGSKRTASALGDEEPAANKSRKTTSDEELQERISADELREVEQAGQAAPFTPQVWFPTYVSRIARVIYHCIADGPAGGLTEDEMVTRTGLPYADVNAGISQLHEKGGIEPAVGDDSRWTVFDEWEDEDE